MSLIMTIISQILVNDTLQMYLYIFLIIFNIVMKVFSKNIDIKSGIMAPVPWSVGLRLYTDLKNNEYENYSVEIHPDSCCLYKNDSNCDIINIFGSDNIVIGPGESKSILMIAPLLHPYERKGHCTLFVDSRPIARPKSTVRDTVKVKFHTKMKRGLYNNNFLKPCRHIDEDPLNNCQAATCDSYYNGKRSYFSVAKKRCVNVPICISRNKNPIAGYNPISNECIKKPSVTQDDMLHVRNLAQNKNRGTDLNTNNDIKMTKIYITNLKDDESELGANIGSLVDKVSLKTQSDNEKSSKIIKKLNPAEKTEVNTVKNMINVITTTKKPSVEHNKTILFYSLPSMEDILSNVYTLTTLAAVIFLQCCLIFTLIYCIAKSCCCFKSKPKVSQVYGYRQDASVTTPLIGTSNIDTDTTEYQYSSESTNYVEKIKCYKACQKDRKNNTKISMSDDILSKCINRRDWNRFPRSDTIAEGHDDEIKNLEDYSVTSKGETKVNFKDEYIHSKCTKHNKHDGGKISENNSTESEIKCHSYESDDELPGFRSSQGKPFGLYSQNKKTKSSEQGAQIYVSNDSLDNFLSERGLVFVGDDASKYSFSSVSAVKSSISSQSSKKSKSKIKEFITLFSRKGKNSDLDSKKDKDLNIGLLNDSSCSSKDIKYK